MLPKIANPIAARYLALTRADHGQWRIDSAWGDARAALPEKLLGHVLDLEEPASAEGWLAAPLQTRSGAGEILLAYVGTAASPGKGSIVN